MKAFVTSLIVMTVITIVAAFGLNLLPMSAENIYTENRNVRL